MTAALATLNQAALVTLADCEQRIERALNGFVDMGQALTEIRDGRLYKATHGNFEAYCQERWEIGRDYADRMIAAAQVVLTIVSKGLPAPTKESQARALVAVPEAERAEVWSAAVERTNGKPTAKAVEDVVKERSRPTQTPKPVGAAAEPPADPGATPEPAAHPSWPTESELKPWETLAPPADRVAESMEPIADDPRDRTHGAEFESYDAAEARIQTPEPVAAPSTAPAGPGAGEAVAPASPGATAEPQPAPSLRLVPTEDEKRAAEQRDARGLLRRAVEILAPDHDRAGFAATWARQLGPYDDELSGLIRRAGDAITTLDELIEGCGQ